MSSSTTVVIPDGGWGWVITTASFLNCIILSSVGLTFGTFLPALVDSFEASRFTLSWIPSISNGVGFCIGPLCSLMGNKWGFRLMGIIGSVIGCIGMLISCFAEHIVVLYISMGIIVGIGQGMVSLCCIVMVSVYFDRKRAIATGISVSGFGAGVFIFGQLVPIFISVYSWRGACLLLAGILLQCCVFCALFRPLDKVVVEPKEKCQRLLLQNTNTILQNGKEIPIEPENNAIGHNNNDIVNNNNNNNNNNSAPNYMGSGYISSVIDLNDVMSAPLGSHGALQAGHSSVVNMYISSINSIANIPIDESKPKRSCLTLFCNVKIFKNVAVSVFMVTNFLLSFSYAPAFTFIMERCMLMGYTEEHSKHFLSAMGILNCLSRLIFGFIAALPCVDKNWLFSISVGGMAFSTLFLPLCKSTWSIMAYCCSYGLFTGNVSMLQSVVLCDLVKSPDELGSALGMLLLVLSVACLFSNPLSGAIYDATKDYDAVFLANGGILLLSFCISIAQPLIVSYRDKKEKHRNEINIK